MNQTEPLAGLLSAIHFAARKHSNQRRKELAASPYINHPVEVAELIARIGGVNDLATLLGAVLHDTLEDTETSPEELESLFGKEVRLVVEEVTDNKKLPRDIRNQLQVEHAPGMSPKAKLIKMADKISNAGAVIHTPPFGWSRKRRLEYLEWSKKVVAGCRGVNQPLENYFDRLMEEGGQVL